MSLSEALARLQKEAHRFNALADAAAQSLHSVERTLASSSIGIDTYVPMNDKHHLGYVNGRILIVEQQKDETYRTRRWEECSREEKIFSATFLPQLVEALLQAVSERTEPFSDDVAAQITKFAAELEGKHNGK